MAISLNEFALFLEDEGRYPEAEKQFRRALAIAERALGPDHPFTKKVGANLAHLNAVESSEKRGR